MKLQDKMVNIELSTWGINTLLYRAYQSNLFSLMVTPDMVPATSLIQLNTFWFSVMAPGAFKNYPYTNMSVQAHATETPVISNIGELIHFTAPMDFGFYVVVNGTGELVEQWVFSANVEANVTVNFNGSNISGDVKDLALAFKLVRNDSGAEVSVSTFNMLIPMVLPDAITQVNAILNKGFNLPAMEGFKAINGESQLGDDYLLLAGDFDFIPPTCDRIREEYKQKYFSNKQNKNKEFLA